MAENDVCGDCHSWQEDIFRRGEWIGQCDRDQEDYPSDTPACELFQEKIDCESPAF